MGCWIILANNSLIAPSNQRLPEPANGDLHDGDPDRRQGQQLWPVDRKAASLQEYPAGDNHVVAQRVDQGQPMDRIRHAVDREGEAGEEHGREDDEEGGHHGLLLRLADGGDQQPDAERTHQKEGCCGQQQPDAAVDRDVEDYSADKADQGDVDVADQYEGEGFAEDKLSLADRGDNHLFDGADLLVPDDGQ